MPTGYAVIGEARTSGRGGGVAIIFRQHFKRAVIAGPCLHHTASHLRSAYNSRRQLRPLCRSLPAEATKTLVRA